MQLCDGFVILAFGRKHSSKLDVISGFPGMCRDKFAEILLCFREPTSPHMNVSQACECVGSWVEGQRLFVLLFGVGELVVLLEKMAGSEVRLRILRLQRRGLMIGGQGVRRI